MEVYKFILDMLADRAPFNLVAEHRFYLGLFILVFFGVLAQILMFSCKRVIFRLTKRTKTKIDDLILEAVEGPLIKVVVFFGLIVGLISLNLHEIIELFLVRVVTSVIILHLTIATVRVLVILIDGFGKKWAKKTKSTVDDDLIPLFGKFTNVLGGVVGFLCILTVWGFQVGPFLASLGIAGIAVGLALKDSLANIFGGMALILDRTFKVGDFVELESGEVGIIHDIGLRATKLRSFSNELVIIPNGQLVNSKIRNHVLPSLEVRVSVDFTVAHGTEISKVKKVAQEVIDGIETVVEEPAPSVPVLGIDDGGIRFSAKFWVADLSDRYSAKVKFNEDMVAAMQKNNIEFAYPPSELYFKKK